jgi:cell division protein FtsQ
MTTTDTTDTTETADTTDSTETADTGERARAPDVDDARADRADGTGVPVEGFDAPASGVAPGDELDVFDDVVDPRLRARWIEARRSEGRRRLRIVCVVVGTLAVLAIAYVIAHSSLLGAGTVEVHGAAATGADTVRTAARIGAGAPLLFLDEGAIARRVEALPTVARAQVSTELPSTVVIRVTERVPVGWTRTAPGATPVAVLDRDGRVLQKVPTPPPLLIEVTGVGVADAPGTHVARPAALHALAGLPDALRAQVARFEIRPKVGPVLVLAGTDPIVDEVQLGSLGRVRAKATAALAVLDTLRAQDAHRHVLGVQVPDAPFTTR